MTPILNTPPRESGGTAAEGPTQQDRRERRLRPGRSAQLPGLSATTPPQAGRAGLRAVLARMSERPGEIVEDLLALVFLIVLWVAALWLLPLVAEVLQ